MIDWEKSKEEVQRKLDADAEWVANALNGDEFLDEDGYPTENALEIIRRYPFTLPERKLFEFIHSIWWMPDWGWKECEVIDEVTNERSYAYYISTGGWSGNESIIQAMQENKWMFWSLTWQQSRRGGHYIFQLRNEDDC